jgi:hypothetical protein
MFGELPKILDRNFVVGYVLPASVFLAVLASSHHVDLSKILTTLNGASFAAAAFALGVVLLAANRSITRLLEGYGRSNPARLMTPIQRWRFRRLDNKLDKADEEYRNYVTRKVDIPKELDRRGIRLMTRFAERWPDDENLVLPTSFGNALRAFECYPYVMYKLRIIEGWNRLIAIVPKDYLHLIDSAKAGTDLWVNSWFLSLVIIADAAFTWRFPGVLQFGDAGSLTPLVDPLHSEPVATCIQPLLTGVAALCFALFASWMAVRAAIEWGSIFKAAVDVYLPALYERLGFLPPADQADLKEHWDDFSYAVAYRIPGRMPERRWVVGSAAVAKSAAADGSAAEAPANPTGPSVAETASAPTQLTPPGTRAASQPVGATPPKLG